MRYAKEVMPTVLATFPPRTSAHLVSKTIGTMWRELSEAQQQPYREAYQADAANARQVADKQELEAVEAKRQQEQLQQQQHQAAVHVLSTDASALSPVAPVLAKEAGTLDPVVKETDLQGEEIVSTSETTAAEVQQPKLTKAQQKALLIKKVKREKPIPGGFSAWYFRLKYARLTRKGAPYTKAWPFQLNLMSDLTHTCTKTSSRIRQVEIVAN